MRLIGLQPNEKAIQPQGGYLVAFRHVPQIAENIERFTERIAQVCPASAYSKDSLHTTISDYKVGPEWKKEVMILDSLVIAVGGCLQDDKFAPSINYNEWLYNPNSVIVAGIPNSEFLRVLEKIQIVLKKVVWNLDYHGERQ